VETCAGAVNKGDNCIGVGDCDWSTVDVCVDVAAAFDFVAALAAAAVVAGEVVVVAQQTQLLLSLLLLMRVVVVAAAAALAFVADHDDRRTDLLPLLVVGLRGKSLLIVVLVRQHFCTEFNCV